MHPSPRSVPFFPQVSFSTQSIVFIEWPLSFRTSISYCSLYVPVFYLPSHSFFFSRPELVGSPHTARSHCFKFIGQLTCCSFQTFYTDCFLRSRKFVDNFCHGIIEKPKITASLLDYNQGDLSLYEWFLQWAFFQFQTSFRGQIIHPSKGLSSLVWNVTRLGLFS